jgi:NTP pyrophosphatase (non-canonical NTP hydrolase)
MVGELGESAELLKKDKYAGKPIDKQELLKETGDLLWYLGLYSDVTGYAFALSPAQDCYTAPQHLF